MGKRPRTIYLVKQLETLVRNRLEAVLLDLQLTPGQYTALSFVAAGPISSAELARRVGITPQTISEMIAALERKSVISREVRNENRRIADIVLTESGHALFREAEARVDLLEHNLLADLSPKQQEQFRGALQVVTRYLVPGLSDTGRF